MSPPNPPLTGTCLCGAVRVLATEVPLLTVACHCRDCQKLSASDYSLTTMVPRDGFSSTGKLVTGGLGTTERTHHYCAACLTFIYSEVGKTNPRINLRTCMLDQAALLAPFVEVMTRDKLPWAQVPVTYSFETAPASPEALQSLIDAYAAS